MTDDALAALGAHRRATRCDHCGAWTGKRHERTCPLAKRGRSSNTRGKRRELEIANAIGGEKVGQYGGPEDIRTPLLNVQSKVRKAFPRWMTDELDKLPRSGGRLPALVVTDAPGSGTKRESIVVMRLADFTDLHGRIDHQPTFPCCEMDEVDVVVGHVPPFSDIEKGERP